MKGAGVKVGLTVLLVALIGYAGFKFVAKGIHGQQGYEVYALFKDATGLLDKSRVQIAGLVVGELVDRRLQYDAGSKTTLARVAMRIKPEMVLWSNAAIYKRTASLLGEYYIEIDPGTPESPSPAGGPPIANYPLKGCVERTGDPACAQIRNVVEAVTASDVLVQVSETLPVLRDILRDVHTMTQGPLQDIARDVQVGIKTNSDAVEKLLTHMDEIAQDMHSVTDPRGALYGDLRESMDNVRKITAGINQIIGTGEGQVNSTSAKIKSDLDQLSVTLAKLNEAIDKVSDLTDKVAEGQGTVGKLLTDDTIAKNVTDITDNAAGFVRSVTRLQTLVDVREDYNVLGQSFKTYLELKLMPRPDKYYLIQLVDDPRGSRTFTHTLQTTSVVNGMAAANGSSFNVDTYTRTPAFRFSFEFAKRLAWRGIGLTGRLGIIESTGGFGANVDFWKERILLMVDMFDFAADYEPLPRLRATAGVEVWKHIWVLGGVDDVLNPHTNDLGPKNITCGPDTPASYCQGGFDYFFGAKLSFNDEDLRSLLAIGGAAIVGGAAASK